MSLDADGKGIGGASAGVFDALVGRSIRRQRNRAGLSRSRLGAACGVSGQQIDKYEAGTNRVPLERFHLIAAALGTDVHALLSETSAELGGRQPPSPLRVKAAELMTLALDMEEELVDHLLALARATVR